MLNEKDIVFDSFSLFIGCTLEKEMVNMADPEINNLKTATFAGGCFWCMEAAFEGIDGIYNVFSGYSGGSSEDADYDKVSTGKTDHLESVQLNYDPTKISYSEILDIYWKQIDPTDTDGQFSDKGPQYKTAIFYHDDEQKKQAEKSKVRIASEFNKPIVTSIIPYESFYKAEEYHQDYSQKRTIQYKLYEKGSGRKKFKEEKWGS